MVSAFSPVEYHDKSTSLAKPLLQSSDDHDDEEAAAATTTANTSRSKTINDNVPHLERPKFAILLVGTILGFTIQIVSLSAYVYTYLRWGDENNEKINIASYNNQDGLLDFLLKSFCIALTQIDLCLYCLIWLAFTASMTKSGVQFIMRRLNPTTKKDNNTLHSRRFVFLLGVNLLVGLVIGAFLSWTLIDFVLGFPVPYAPIVCTVVIDLVLCYFMIVCYDCGRNLSAPEDIHENNSEYKVLQDDEEM